MGAVQWQERIDVALPGTHPASHGLPQLRVDWAPDSTVARCEVVTGSMHRSAEKLFEVRDYRQCLALGNRHDWLSSFASEWGLALLLERLLGMAPPPRATWLSTVMAETTRIVHHLLWLDETLALLGEHDPSRAELREALVDLVEAWSGARMHTTLVRPGGLNSDPPPDWTQELLGSLEALSAIHAATAAAIERHAARLSGLAVVSGPGATGPVGRAAGRPLDLRRDQPYGGYGELEVARVTYESGDALARLQVLNDELLSSRDLIHQACERVEPGPISLKLPKVLRVPESEGYLATESPTGVNGWYLVSRGERTPYRLKIRSASFAHAQSAGDALAGLAREELPLAFATLLLVSGDQDR